MTPLTPLQLTVATANTYFGQLINTPDGLASFSSVDILLLQEVFNLQDNDLSPVLQKAGFTLLHAAPQFGLAIAYRQSPLHTPLSESIREFSLAKLTNIERHVIEKATRTPLTPNERGLITCKVRYGNGQHFIIATTHPTTPISIKSRARYRQVKKLWHILATNFSDMPLIIGGDMNHYPGPRKIDKAFHAAMQLTPVEIGQEPTWRVQGSKQEKLLSLAARLLQKEINDFDGQHDTILYTTRAISSRHSKVVDIASDHRAIIADLQLNTSLY